MNSLARKDNFSDRFPSVFALTPISHLPHAQGRSNSGKFNPARRFCHNSTAPERRNVYGCMCAGYGGRESM